jgi:Mini-chromosome maintenance replisome factor
MLMFHSLMLVVVCTFSWVILVFFPDGNALANVATVRDEALAVLEHALLGDRLAAEFLLCHLVSSV